MNNQRVGTKDLNLRLLHFGFTELRIEIDGELETGRRFLNQSPDVGGSHNASQRAIAIL